MATIRIAKVVATLPATLLPDTLYAVRAGVGFDFYISDLTGSVAWPLNSTGATSLVWSTEEW